MHLQSNIFGENDKNKNDEINKIKERIKIAQDNDEDHPKKVNTKLNKNNKK